MSEKFWIQDADGKLDGSLPDVPKKGYIAEVSEKDGTPFVSKEQNEVDAKKASDPHIISDKQLVAILKMLKKGLSMGRHGNILRNLGIDPAVFTLEEVTAMVEMFVQLRKMLIANDRAAKLGLSDKEREGMDKYYHCRAHCIAARVGLGGIAASYPAGYAKEVNDLFKSILGYDYPGSIDKRIVACIKDSIGDLAANSTGRLGNPHISCNTNTKLQS